MGGGGIFICPIVNGMHTSTKYCIMDVQQMLSHGGYVFWVGVAF